MEFKQVDLYEHFGIARPSGAWGYLSCYIHDQTKEFCTGRKRPAIVVAPGGGYEFLSSREGEPIALYFLNKGFNAFVLKYSVAPIKYPAQLIEGAMAMAYIRSNATDLHVDADHVGMVGFSAGGHLTAMLATMYDSPIINNSLGKNASLARPNAVILSYPVVSSENTTAHMGSFNNLVGDDQQMRDYLSIEKRVDKNSVPAFIWCTVDDDIVPSANSMLLASAYHKAGVPFEFHMFESGVHGLALANRETTIVGSPWLGMHRIDQRLAGWIDLAHSWLEKRGFEIIN